MVELSSCVWLLRNEFSQNLRSELTLDVFKLGSDEPTVVEAFRKDRKGYIGVPRVFGLKLISNRSYEDKRSVGVKVSFPKKVQLRDYQEPFVEAMLDSAASKSDFIAKAGTGKGKTVCGLAVIQKLGRSAVVIVDQTNLMDQWVDRCVEHLGMKREDVGIVQGSTLDYKGKAITICMVQTLSQKDFPDEFYEYFGVVVFDEVQVAGAPTFSKALTYFPARIRFGLSATPHRRDALNKLLEWNLGSVGALLESEHSASSVYIVEQYGTYSWSANNSKLAGRFINEVADDSMRNLSIANAIKWLYESGRDILVIGDRVEHLCSLMGLCEAVGIPRSDLGLYAKQKTVFVYEKDPTPKLRPSGWVKGTEYSPVRLVLKQKTVPKKNRDAVAGSSRVVFATYGIMAKGVDIPRLSAGVDATPRSEATQVLGRILRIQKGKLRPIWVTFADMNSFRSLYQLANRLRDYTNSNAEVFLWDSRKGRKRLDQRLYSLEIKDRVKELRQSQIVTSLDGNYTLVMPATRSANESYPVRRTGRISR